MALPLTLAIGYFAWSGAMEELLWTTFVFPLQAVSAQAATKSVLFLARSAFWFGRLFLTMGLLSAVGLWHVLRYRRTEFDNLTIMWLVAGSVVILVQRSSWWHYHLLLLVVPLGLLAGRGVDWLAGEWPSIRVRVRVGVSIVLVAAMVPAMYVMMAKAVPLIRNDFALTQLGKERYETAVSPSYGAIRIDGSFLDESDALPGSIYVFGDPTYNYLFKRDQAIPINGWSPEYWNEDVWDRAHTDLVTVVPPYVRVASWAAELMEEHHSSTASFLETRYTILSRTPSGTWYQR
jgi:hypothetical protein